MRILRDFGRFWYELLVGDDWKIAVSVVVALALAGIVLTQTGATDHTVAVIGGALVVVGFSVSVVLDVREKRPPRG
jgi:hypothetical protein